MEIHIDNKKIQIFFSLKHMGNIRKKIKEHPVVIGKSPRTFRELIEETVKSCVDAYNDRAYNGKTPMPLTDEEFNSMCEIGKFAFGVNYNDKKIDEKKAIDTAIEAVTDGIVRVFKGDDEITNLDTEIDVFEGDVFTFVRLTMLSGRMW